MLITRWQAPINPNKEQIKILLEAEGLDPYEESLASQSKVAEYRQPFGEVRFVIEGELLFNVAGNQVLLRAGDRIEIPSNTRHSYANNSSSQCLCICANRPF